MENGSPLLVRLKAPTLYTLLLLLPLLLYTLSKGLPRVPRVDGNYT